MQYMDHTANAIVNRSFWTLSSAHATVCVEGVDRTYGSCFSSSENARKPAGETKQNDGAHADEGATQHVRSSPPEARFGVVG